MSQQVQLEQYTYSSTVDDPDANFRRDVAFYSAIDPMPTLESMSRRFAIPTGALVKYVLAKWATSGSDGLLEVGPSVARQMAALARQAEAEPDERKRLELYRKLGRIASWLDAGLPRPPSDGR